MAESHHQNHQVTWGQNPTLYGLRYHEFVSSKDDDQTEVEYNIEKGLSPTSSLTVSSVCEDSVGDETSPMRSLESYAHVNHFLLRCSVLVCLTSCLLGYDIGVFAGAVVLIKKHFGLDDFETEVTVGSLNYSATIGVFVAGRVADRYGRRCGIIYTALLFLVGAGLMSAAWAYWLFICGRLITGFAVGGGLVITPLYICELAPPKYRAALTSMTEVSICVGVLSGYLVSLFMDIAIESTPYGDELAWRLMLGISCIPPLIMLLGLKLIPESPRWLVMRGDHEGARRILSNILGAEADGALQQIIDNEAARAVENAQSDQSCGKLKALYSWSTLHPAIRAASITSIGVAFLSQATGIEAVTYYSDIILRDAGFETHRQALVGTVIMGLFKVSFVLIFTFTADSIGRRPLGLSSCTVMALSMGIFGIGYFTEAPPVLNLVAFTTFVCAFSFGLGPLTYLVPAELFPQHWRAWGVSATLFVARLTAAIVASTYLSMVHFLTPGGVHLLFAAVGTFAVAFIYNFLPETKNVTLEEIDQFGGH